MQAAGGVEHHHVVAAERRLLLGALGDGDRVLAGDDRQGVDADLQAEHRELLHRGRAAGVEARHQHALAVAFLEALGEFRGGGGLARALQADHQDRRGRVVDPQIGDAALAGEHPDQLVVHDFHDLLAGGDGFRDRLALGLILHRLDEIARDGQRDVGLEQRDADLAQRGRHVLVGQRAGPGQLAEDAAKAVGQVLEHGLAPRSQDPETRKRAGGRNALTGGDPALRDRTGSSLQLPKTRLHVQAKPGEVKPREGQDLGGLAAGWYGVVGYGHAVHACTWDKSLKTKINAIGINRKSIVGRGFGDV